jgi:magnesium transporter
MREIESSNRHYEDHGAVYLTATILTKLDTDLPQSTQITFILKNGKLVTNRYADPLPFRRFVTDAERHAEFCNSDAVSLAGPIESIVNRSADVVERVGADLDAISVKVFARSTPARQRARQRNYRTVLEHLGQSGNLIAKTRESWPAWAACCPSYSSRRWSG